MEARHQALASMQSGFRDEGDVMVFFFYFENVAMRGKDEKEKAVELLALLDGAAFDFYFEKLTINSIIYEAGEDFL